MFPSPRVLIALMMILSGLLTAVFTLLVVIWSRLRALPLAELTRRVEELTARQRALEELLARSEGNDAQRIASKAFPPARQPSQPAFGVASSRQRMDGPETSAVTGPTLIAIPNLTTPPADAAEAAAVELGRRFGTIWEQADSGVTPETIARNSGQPIGQVELILALRRQLAANSGSRS